MKLKNFKITHKGLYWGLIFTFALLYLCVGFVSTLHSITFFGLANNVGLAILLGLTYEIGQASVLFSILMSKNKDKFLPWALMILLTALQVTANVYASFKFMSKSGSDDWMYWQKSILIGVQAQNAEMYQVIISWIAGALLPIVALGMIALVAQNMNIMSAENDAVSDAENEDTESKEPKIYLNKEWIEQNKDGKVESEIAESKVPDRENPLLDLKEKLRNNIFDKASEIEQNPLIGEAGIKIIKKPISFDLTNREEVNEEFERDFNKSLDNLKNIPTVPAGDNGNLGLRVFDENSISKEKLDEIVQNEVERRLNEVADKKKIAEQFKFSEELENKKDEFEKYLDEEVEKLSSIMDNNPINSIDQDKPKEPKKA
jgi:hypothetical protein